jgi:hypothetical protein
MVEVKEMSYGKKYSSVLDYMKLLEDYVLPLVKEDLGDKEVAELEDLEGRVETHSRRCFNGGEVRNCLW